MESKDSSIDLLNLLQSPVGWKTPQCVKCVYNQMGFCTKFNAKRQDVKVDIFNCPEFKEK